MPTYVYRVVGTDDRFEAVHRMSERPKTLGELCRIAELDLDDRDPDQPVERLIQPVGISVPKFNSELANQGFTKLEKRSDGSYENVTKTDHIG